MTHRFATIEDAALFASMKRDQGYFAEVLHVNVGHLWGPLAMTGFSVLVSEFAADEGEEVPGLSIKVPSLPRELSMLVASATLATVAVLSLLAGFHVLKLIAAFPLPALTIILRLGLFITLLAALGCFLSEWTRVFRDPAHRLHGLAYALHDCMTWLLILFRIL